MVGEEEGEVEEEEKYGAEDWDEEMTVGEEEKMVRDESAKEEEMTVIVKVQG